MNLTPDDILFLESLARRLSKALYYGKLGPIGTNGGVSSGLLHDDYDRLRKLAEKAKLSDWDRQHTSGGPT